MKKPSLPALPKSTVPLKVISVIATAGLLLAAFGVGGEKPLSPAELARSSGQARSDLHKAVENTLRTADSAASFAVIAENVRRQLAASRRLLEIQAGLERSSRRSLATSKVVVRRIARLKATIAALKRATALLGDLSERLNDSAGASAAGADALTGQLGALGSRFAKVIRQSRELNKKARAFEKSTGDVP